MIKKHLLLFTSILSFALPLFIKPIDIFFGTSGRGSEGIYYATFNPKNGKFTPSKLAAKIGSPGFLTTHPNGKFLYSLGRWEENAGTVGYHIGPKGELKEFTPWSAPTVARAYRNSPKRKVFAYGSIWGVRFYVSFGSERKFTKTHCH